MLNIEDPVALATYLGSRGLPKAASMEVLHGGVSNRVVLVRWSSGTSWVIKQALPKLRVAVDWYSSPERIHREALALLELKGLGVSVPRLVFEDLSQHVLAMEAVPEPHRNWKTLLLSGDVQQSHVLAFAHILAAIHTRSTHRRNEIEPVFRDTSYFESLRIEPYYTYAASQVPEAARFIHQVIDATRSNRLCLVHGDYSPKNVLIWKDQMILLDHEVSHWGDPAFDLGFALTHLLSKAHHVAQYRSDFEDAAVDFWAVYRAAADDETWAATLEPRAVASILACLLARVCGRSRLEYMREDERARQRAAVLALMAAPPTSVPDIIHQFVKGISTLKASASG